MVHYLVMTCTARALFLLVAIFNVSATAPLHAATAREDLTALVKTVTNFLHATSFEPPRTVTLGNGIKAQTIVFQHTEWQLKELPQSVFLSQQLDTEARVLPEKERLERMNRFDDYTQLWLVPLAENPGADAKLKELLPPNQQPNRYHRELAFLGQGRGYAFYGHMPIYEWTALQSQLNLRDGDDPLAAAVRALSIEDQGGMTRNSMEGVLAAGGAKAIPYLKQVIATTNFARGFAILGYMKDREATRLLLQSATSPNPEKADVARQMLESYPRPEAESLYLKWLDQDAGRKPVLELLRACARMAPRKLAPYLPRVLASPKSVNEYCYAFEQARSIAGKSIPAELLMLEEQIEHFGYASSTNFNQAKVDQAVAQILQTRDPEAAAMIALRLAVATTKGDWRAANKAGVEVLHKLPGNSGKDLIRRVENSISDSWVKEKLRSAAP